jgi:hypothetical protein
MAAIFCYSGDSSDSVIATFSGNSDGLSHLLPTDSEYTRGHLEKSDRLFFDAESVYDYQSAFSTLKGTTTHLASR